MNFNDLLRSEPKILAFGFLLAFGSSAGQTFFISLFIPDITAALAIDAANMALLYGLATLAAGFTLPLVGGWIDRWDIVRFAALSAILLLFASGLLVSAASLLAGFVAFYFLRLSGQGLMSHTAFTGVARYFTIARGKALSIAGLGNAAGEALFPVCGALLIAALGWRLAFVTTVTVVVFLIVPCAFWLIWHKPRFRRIAPGSAVGSAGSGAFFLLRSPRFWFAFIPLLATPLVVTALVFHHGIIAAYRGVSLLVFAAGFLAYAGVQLPAVLWSGALVDRYGWSWPLALHVLPMALGVALLWQSSATWAIWTYLGAMGVTAAFSGVLRTYVIADMVPPEQLGAARSLVTALMVSATAAGPVLLGQLLQHSSNIDALLGWTSLLCVVCALPSLILLPLHRQSKDST